ncbi:hypothetical protein BDL97_14G068000 [Sphagnum fallax]|nr:hypothetical protein BDL97_14G068000 [Sphagnum fallax]KAH8941868.1 hypothetical protein BDL97_14G068000 [Sphagnum fallax]
MEHSSSEDPALQLPIDISYSKLADWLVDRRKIPSDWRKKLASLRTRVASALSSSLPRNSDPWLQSLTAENTGYLEARRIRDLLLQANPEARNLFGRLSGSAGEWDAIVKVYEKELLFLGEAAQLMVQYTNYEIPYQKKQIVKVQQQLTDMERKEAEFRRNAAASAVKYQQACQELGIQGNDVRAELMALRKSLPAIFTEVVNAICSDTVGDSLELYQAFVSYAHQGPESGLVLPTLRQVRDHPPAAAASVPDRTEDNKASSAGLPVMSESSPSPEEQEALELKGDIDWNIEDVDSGKVDKGDASINWDIGHDAGVKIACEAEESGGGIDWCIEQHLITDEAAGTEADNVGSDINWDIGIDTLPSGVTSAAESAQLLEGSTDGVIVKGGDDDEDGGGINWDIDVDDVGVDTLQSGSEETGKVLPVTQDSRIEQEMGRIGCFVQTEYRNRLLDDLCELRAFVKQRLEEMGRHDTAALQNQVQAVMSPACTQHGSDTLLLMTLHIATALELLTARKTRDLSLLVTSSRFLDRLEASLLLKKQNELKLVESSRDLSQKRVTLRNSLTLLWPKQEAAVTRLREVKQNTEKTISSLYDGRPVNIIGDINTMLGPL